LQISTSMALASPKELSPEDLNPKRSCAISLWRDGHNCSLPNIIRFRLQAAALSVGPTAQSAGARC
jgi:hypothetical protein